MTALLADLAQSWWEWCAAVSVQVAVLFAVVAVLDRLLRHWVRPQVLGALWLLVVVKLFVPPTLGSPVSLSNLWEDPSVLVAQLPPARASGGAVLDGSALNGAGAFFVWLVGCVFFAAACLWRCRGLKREWPGEASEPLPDALAALCREAAQRLGLKRLPQVRVARGARGGRCARGPAVVGFVRPLVVLPARLIETAGREEVAHVLLHEFAHLKRHDPLLQLFCLVAQVVFWFHPCVWLARRRLSTLAELCCDQAVAAALGGSTAGYRRTLLRLARPMLAPQHFGSRAFGSLAFGSLGFFRRRSQLLLRIEGLDRLESGRRKRSRPLVRRILSGGLCALVLVSCVPLARPRAGEAEFSPPPLESLQGCLQVRYAVQAALARQRFDHVAKQAPNI